MKLDDVVQILTPPIPAVWLWASNIISLRISFLPIKMTYLGLSSLRHKFRSKNSSTGSLLGKCFQE